MIDVATMNTVYTAMRMAEEYVQKHAGLKMICRLEAIEDQCGDPKQIMSVVAEALGEDVSNYYIKTRKKHIAEMRMLATFFIKRHFPLLSLGDIGYLFGKNDLDHSCISYYLKKVEELTSNPDKDFTRKYRIAENALEKWIRQ